MDHARLLTLAERVLRLEGYQVTTVANGEDVDAALVAKIRDGDLEAGRVGPHLADERRKTANVCDEKPARNSLDLAQRTLHHVRFVFL